METLAAHDREQVLALFENLARPAGDDLVSQLDDLAKLRERGVLSTKEFEAAKSRLLGG